MVLRLHEGPDESAEEGAVLGRAMQQGLVAAGTAVAAGSETTEAVVRSAAVVVVATADPAADMGMHPVRLHRYADA